MAEVLRLTLLELRLRRRTPGLPLLALLLVVLTAAYLPPASASYQTLSVYGQRGLYTSAWVGLVISVLGSVAFSLPAFLLVRGRTARDAGRRVLPLLLASPLRPATLLLSRWLAQTLYLWVLWGLVALTSLPLLLVRGEADGVQLFSLIVPTLLITAPTLALVSAVATVWDCLPALGGLGGSLAYLMLWAASVMLAILGPGSAPDPLGVRLPLLQVAQALAPASDAPPAVSLGSVDLNVGVVPAPVRSAGQPLAQQWSGLTWNTLWILSRLGWLPVSALLVWLGAQAFRAPRLALHASVRPSSARLSRLPGWAKAPGLRVALTEVRLATGSIPRWLPWVSVGLWLVGWTTPSTDALLLIVGVPLACQLVTLPRRTGMADLLSSAARQDVAGTGGLSLARTRLMALVLLLPASSALLRHLSLGELAPAAGLLASVLLTLTLLLLLEQLEVQALNMEIGLLLLWYAGPFNRLEALDSSSPAHWPLVLGVALLLGLVTAAVQYLRFSPSRRALPSRSASKVIP